MTGTVRVCPGLNAAGSPGVVAPTPKSAGSSAATPVTVTAVVAVRVVLSVALVPTGWDPKTTGGSVSAGVPQKPST